MIPSYGETKAQRGWSGLPEEGPQWEELWLSGSASSSATSGKPPAQPLSSLKGRGGLDSPKSSSGLSWASSPPFWLLHHLPTEDSQLVRPCAARQATLDVLAVLAWSSFPLPPKVPPSLRAVGFLAWAPAPPHPTDTASCPVRPFPPSRGWLNQNLCLTGPSPTGHSISLPLGLAFALVLTHNTSSPLSELLPWPAGMPGCPSFCLGAPLFLEEVVGAPPSAGSLC
ncbi:uncharacterized protein C5orf52 homolog isoform X1 [Vombatus ursinus]|uniref:uncharacterized protein C5orf52 homolog isoform X1 n=1 Tax=Vombatus ursinus TaxID=29139 RepID=UPI000FFDB7F8|nr:uncharacterized protein C5orf52 homolog isoform X1 [Vombatus ursinus]